MAQDVRAQVAGFLRCHGLTGSTLLVAVSGGPDSVCLLHVLAGLKEELGLELRVAHLDHGLRPDSEDDARYVKSLARRLGLPCSTLRVDVMAYRREHKLSLEEAAREVRYLFLAEAARRSGTKLIATGHTASDNTETIFLHLIRGTGVRGLAGMKPMTALTLAGSGMTVVRPLLAIPRSETERYCREHALDPHLDMTNLSLGPLRNRVRLRLLPLLRRLNPGIEAAMGRLAAAAGSEDEYLEGQATALWGTAAEYQPGLVILHKDILQALPSTLQRHVLRQAFDRLLGTLKDVEWRHIEDIIDGLSLPAGRRLDLPYGLAFLAGYDRYWLGRPDVLPSPFPALDGEHPLLVPGKTILPGWTVSARFVHSLPPDNVNGLVAFMDGDAVGRALSVRSWRRGDRFQPLGLGSEKKIGEYLIGEKVPRHWRARVPIVAASGRIVWLAGYRLDERAKVIPATKRVLRLEFQRLT